jgi:hypothetical protein
MATTAQIAFKAAQSEILASAPAHFTLNHLPPIGWWRAKYELGLAAVALLHHFQSVLGTSPTFVEGLNWQTGSAAHWQAASGITPKQWEGAKTELGPDRTHLLSFIVRKFSQASNVCIRPSEELLGIFGMKLKTYDSTADLDRRVCSQPNNLKAPAAGVPISEEELDALALWASRGGLPRLRAAKYLGGLLEAPRLISRFPSN